MNTLEQIGVAELKARLNEYLARVQAGEEIIVADQGRPIARLVPAPLADTTSDDAVLRDLERRGLVRMGVGSLSAEFWEFERPLDPEAAILSALIEERDEGR